MLQDGLYEQVISESLDEELSLLAEDHHIETVPLDIAEAPKILSQYVKDLLEQKLEAAGEGASSVEEQIDLVNRVVSVLANRGGAVRDDGSSSRVSERAEQLFALFDRTNSALGIGSNETVARPDTSIAHSSLFTGAVHEPQMYTELKKEIDSSNRIDMLVSFIKWSGLRLILDELDFFTRNGGSLRVITTSYMGATDVKAIEELQKLPNVEIKVSYDTKRTRLHAKTYVFYRDTGFTTAYVGSSNLSNAAISSGLEWNVKVTRKDLPETIDKIAATFESYWNSNEFVVYDESQRARLAQAIASERHQGAATSEVYTIDVAPYPYQQEILDQLQAEREVRGRNRNLVVAATGTGKTVVAALDYKRFCAKNAAGSNRLLFIAHREEILKQSLSTFRAVMKDANFGELFVGGYRPNSLEHLFVSIQTVNSSGFTERTTSDYYDFIVVDEFHHAAARTYQKVLEHYQPKVLLGLTATPERMDGRDILGYFGGRIAAEIRLPEAIDRKLLCPFQYFGVTDTVDLADLKWAAGGYDRSELTRVYTFEQVVANRRANHVVESLMKYVTDINDVKGLGFCVSIEHAQFMSRYFNEHGIPSLCLTGNSSAEERNSAKQRLVGGQVRFIFVVDIYNEGVDIPEVNTTLFLRPTESLTVFLQQLGRGLRLSEGKECLTVLDFIGQANKKYSFEDKFSALMANTTRSVEREIRDGFVSVPKGCYVQLEKVAAQHILDNIKASYGNRSALVSRIASFEEDTGQALTLSNYLRYYHLDPRIVYRRGSFSRLSVLAGAKPDYAEPAEDALTKSFLRFAVVDSRRFIGFLLDVLPRLSTLDFASLSDAEMRMLRMFYVTVWTDGWDSEKMRANMEALSQSPTMMGELIELLRYRYDCIDFVDQTVDIGFDCPLDLHCTYTRDQLLVAMDFMKPGTVREGVKWLEDKALDVFFVTLNKSDKDYSPTTMYQDYSINERLFHWQSQSTTTAASPTGQRYIHHRERGSRVLLFVREFRTDHKYGGTGAYTYLGTASYVKHEGDRPMNIVWRLDYPIPARFLKKTNKLLVG